MNDSKVADILKQFGMRGVVSWKLLPPTTSGNDTYSVDLGDRGVYVLKTLVRQSRESAEAEYKIQQLLSEAGIVTPRYLPSIDNAITVEYSSVQYVLSPSIDGFRQDVDTLQLAKDMGCVLAKMHYAVKGIALLPNEQQWFNPRNVISQLKVYNGPDKEYIADKSTKLFSLFEKGLPVSFTHGDLHTKNIFSENDKVTAVFDFESAEYSLRIFDLARTYLTYRKVTDLKPGDILNSLLAGYDSATCMRLAVDEVDCLNDAFIYVALLTAVSIYNHGNAPSSSAYLCIARQIEADNKR